MTEIEIGLSIVALIGIIVFTIGCLTYKDTMQGKDIKYKKLENENKKILGQKKSSEVRLGKMGENLAQFTKHWPYNINNFRFLGSPIDGIQFTNDEILIVEIKTGGSRLSNKQERVKERVKELVENGKVRFVSFSIDTDKITIE